MKILWTGVILIFSLTTVHAADALKSTLEDQASVAVTVYNSNMGLVKDVRKISVPAGEGELRFMDVAAFIRPETVHVKSLTAPDKLAVLEQNYEYDLINETKLLDKYVGQKIKLLDINPYQDRKETVEATLISNNNGQVYEIGNEIYLGYPGIRILPKLPENLIAKPTLTWLFESAAKAVHEVEVSYLTGNITWKADYVLVVNKDDTQGDLSGWVTLNNTSGATYKDAKLKLVAGDVNVVATADDEAIRERSEMVYASGMARGFQEESFFEYHLYDLQRPTTVKNNQSKQVSLLEAKGASVVKEFIASSGRNWWVSQNTEPVIKQPVEVKIKVKNSEKNHLGMPLPKGIVRLYKQDAAGSLQFIGEDRIDHTPKDEEIMLKVGEAFDLVVERRQIAFRRIDRTTYESDWEVKLRNHKKEDVVINVVDATAGFSDWQVLNNSLPFEKLNASLFRFAVSVPKDGESVLTYTVRVKY